MDAVILQANTQKSRSINQRLDSGQCDCDCDCACADTIRAPFLFHTSLESWEIVPGVKVLPLPDGWHGMHSPNGYSPFVLLDRPTHKLWLGLCEMQEIDPLSLNMERSKLVNKMAKAGLLQPTGDEVKGKTINEQQLLTAWLHLTDRCNLRCSYCYLPHVHEDMSSEKGHAAVDAIFRSAVANHFKQVKLKFAGGEPLLCFQLIDELYGYAQSLAEIHGISLEGVVLSNGTLLTPEIFETLKSLSLRLMISVDGIDSFHDAHRPYAGGRGSFKDVAEAVDLAISHGLSLSISVTVSSRTASGLPTIMAWILERELPFSLNFYRENELSASHEDMQLDERKIIDGMLVAFKVIEDKLPRRPFLGGIVDRSNLTASHTHACGVGQNYLVFDQNGQVAKCQMQIRKPITDIYVADPLAVIRADQIGIQNMPVDEKEGCKTCEWKNWCAGGCPLTTFRATGRYDIKSPNCNIYKALFPEALRLEGLRLLKYQNDPDVVVRY